jgi:hypothetical protein
MPVSHDLQLSGLTTQLTDLQSDLLQFGKRSELQKIIDLIRVKKGWTTPAELAFASTIVKSIQLQVQQLGAMLTSFEAAAHQVQVQEKVGATL